MTSIKLTCKDFPCVVCKHEVTGELITHLKICTLINMNCKNSESQTEIIDTYFILLYILGVFEKWEEEVNIYKFSNYLLTFQIYEHFHHLNTNTLWKSALIGTDNLTRIILSVINKPENLNLQIPPDLEMQDFSNNKIITNMNYLFTNEDITKLKEKSTNIFENNDNTEKSFVKIANKANTLLDELKRDCDELRKLWKNDVSNSIDATINNEQSYSGAESNLSESKNEIISQKLPVDIDVVDCEGFRPTDEYIEKHTFDFEAYKTQLKKPRKQDPEYYSCDSSEEDKEIIN